jgi:cytochrome P450
MEFAAQIDLPFLEMESDGFAADPFPHFAAARKRHPWLARWALGYVVTDYRAMLDFFRMENRMRTQFDDIVTMMDAEGTPWGRFQHSHILNQSGAAHNRLRSVLAASFTPRQAKLHRPLMRRVIVQLLDEWAPMGKFDFEEFASYFPVSVMCTLIGAPLDAIAGLRASMEAIGLSTSMDRRWLPAMQRGVETMDAFVFGLIADRRGGCRIHADRDLLDLLLDAQSGGDLTDRELADILIFLFVAGYDTSKNMLTLIMQLLLDRPELYARCARDPDFCSKVVKETFRYHSTTSSQRVLAEDVVYRDVLLPRDTMMWFPLSVATHDRRLSPDAEQFDPDRKNATAHIGFGLGAHICLGQFIARAQIEEGLHLIAQRLHNPTSTGPMGWRPFPGTWGIRGLPIAFDPAPETKPELVSA